MLNGAAVGQAPERLFVVYSWRACDTSSQPRAMLRQQ